MRMSIAGINTYTKGRIMRLCMTSGGKAMGQPMGRLGKFAGLFLRPKRAGGTRVGVDTESLSFCDRRVGS